jgi:hypothetical protein
MVNMRMRANNCPHLQPVPLQNLENAPNIVARINNNRLPRRRVAQDRTIALQHPHGDDFMNQLLRHKPEYTSTHDEPTPSRLLRGVECEVARKPTGKLRREKGAQAGVPVPLEQCVPARPNLKLQILFSASRACPVFFFLLP